MPMSDGGRFELWTEAAVFVDGCFWHSCPEHGRRPSVNQSYWSPKLARNAERDERNTRMLTEAGWTVVRIWEHESVESGMARVVLALGYANC